jgi:hypothetical protein
MEPKKPMEQPGPYMNLQMQNVQMQPTQTAVPMYPHVPKQGMKVAKITLRSHYPVTVLCPKCNTVVTTKVEYRVGLYALIWFFCLLCTMIWFWIPLVCKPCHDAVHECPNCHATLGGNSKGVTG